MTNPETPIPPADRLASLRIDRSAAPRRSRAGVYWLLALIVVAGTAVAWWLGPWRLPEVVTTRARVEAASGPSPVLTVTGFVVARREASVSPKITGKLVFLGVDAGSRVRGGEIIARLDDRDSRAGLAAAKARLEEARLELERQRRLFAQGVSQRAVLDSAEATFTVAEADLEVAAALLDNTVIRAPFDGIVLQKLAEVGETVSPGFSTRTTQTSAGAIAEIADPSSYEVEADVTETNLTKAREGSEARITLDAYPGAEFPGTLRQIEPTADRQKAVVQVKVAFADPDPRILPQMSATVTFLSGEGAGEAGAAGPVRVFVPENALRGSAVLVVEEDRVRERQVVTGEKRPGEIEILSGVRAGEEVVAAGPDDLGDGSRVRRKKGS